jgi:hypothetical protein
VMLPPVILVARTCSAGRARRRAAPSYGVIGQPPPLLKNWRYPVPAVACATLRACGSPQPVILVARTCSAAGALRRAARRRRPVAAALGLAPPHRTPGGAELPGHRAGAAKVEK